MKLNEYRVIKKIPKASPFFKQLKKEARFLSEYSSDFLPRLFDVEEDSDNLYLVEEYVKGKSLSSDDFLKDGLSEDGLVSIAYELFEFLKFINSLNAPVLYIDWKPGNILLCEDGLRVVDFGSVCYLEEDSDFIGLATEGFAAPELKNGGKLGLYTDIYGFGSIIKYLAEHSEKRKRFLGLTAREKLVKLAARCTDNDENKRAGQKEIGRVLSHLRKKKPAIKLADKCIVEDINSSKIGVCGSETGVGATHVAFFIAKELAKKGHKVAYIAIGEEGQEDITKPECLKNVKVYKNIYEEDIAYFLKKEFDNLIIDFGRADEFSILFHSCDEKLAVVQNNFIKGKSFEKFLTNHKEDIGAKGWIIVDNLSDADRLAASREMMRKMGIKAKCKGMGMERI